MAKRKDRVKRPTMSEKLSLMYGNSAWTIRGIPRIKLEPVRTSDGPAGLRYMPNDSLDIGESSSKKPSIAYPCEALIACSFDTDLIEEYGRLLACEFKAANVDAILGPGINIKRNPLCGRNFEYFSEDPYLSGMLAASFTKGAQSLGVATCLKHFACNSQESYRMVNNSVVDERTLHEIYLRGFQIAIEECSPWMIMASYNLVNGTYACENKELLLDTLKGKWHYSGVVVSDWGAVNDPVLCHENGLDVEMPCLTRRQQLQRQTQLMLASDRGRVGRKQKEGAEEGVTKTRAGKLSRLRINDIAERVIRLSERVHNAHIKKIPFDVEDGKGHALAVKLAEKSTVLVKNNGILPLKSLTKLAIVGELAEKPRLGGGGSSQVRGHGYKSFLQCCVEVLGENNVRYRRGYDMGQEEHMGKEGRAELILEAADLASTCDKVILFLGTTAKMESEGSDRGSLRLPDDQVELFHTLSEVNPNLIVVLATGAPVEIGFAEAAAELITYFPGEGGGEALYNLITGISNPSGHLAETWPTRNTEVPSFGFYPGDQSQSLYREAIYVGYRYFVTTEKWNAVRFPFGWGMSYSKFQFENLRASSKKPIDLEDGPLSVKLTVHNISAVDGEALVQLYVRPVGGNVFKAKRTLQAFKKVFLKAGEKADVELLLDRRAFEHYDVASGEFLIEGGKYVLEIGESCMDRHIVQSVNVEIKGDQEFPSLRTELAIYYKPPKDGFWLYDDAYERLLGRKVPFPKDPRARPYTLNSTIENIRGTPIGRTLLSKAEKTIGTHDENDPVYRAMLELPIRNISMHGSSDKTAQFIVDCANGNVVLAVWNFLFRRTKHKS